MILRGTNDVDDSNSGIIVSDNAFGQIRVDWDEFDKVVFSQPARQVQYNDLGEVKLIRGTVYTEDGESYSGNIRWDDDEEYTWDGRAGGRRLPIGIYIVYLEATGAGEIKKTVVLAR